MLKFTVRNAVGIMSYFSNFPVPMMDNLISRIGKYFSTATAFYNILDDGKKTKDCSEKFLNCN